MVSVTRTINAPAGRIFDLLADPAAHPVIDGSGTVRAAGSGGTDRLRLGSEFGMDMKLGLGYRITNKVVEFEENRLIAWRHFAGHRWRWELEPAGDDVTEVTETFDWERAPAGPLYVLVGLPKRHLQSMHKSLQRLENALGNG
jgi:uncharacterized protein YndB with AHSA1/START domain